LSANDKLRVCFDTNHLLGEDIISFIKRMGDKIVTIHVSDYDYIDERHWLPGEGLIDWVALIDTLDEIGYEGDWIYECGLKPKPTIIRERDLTFEDLYKNAQEVSARQKPTRYSVPKPGVGMWE
jgi:sugar phosphate isomerase/epimerase